MDDGADPANIERLLAWVRETRERRERMPEVIAELRRMGVAYKTIREIAGVPISTAQAWATRVEG